MILLFRWRNSSVPPPLMCAFCAFFASRLGLRDIPRASAGRARQAALLTPPKSSHPRPLLSRQHSAPVSPLAATLTNRPASIANKRLTTKLTPLNITLTKNKGAGVALQLSAFLRSNVQRCNSFSVTSLAAPHLATSIESHPYKNQGEGGRPAPNNSHSGTRRPASPKQKGGGRKLRLVPPRFDFVELDCDRALTRRDPSDRPWPAFRLPSPRPWRSCRASACGWTWSGSGACRQPSPCTRKGPRS
jgi:hypothetical protein